MAHPFINISGRILLRLALFCFACWQLLPATPIYAGDPTFAEKRNFGTGEDDTRSVAVGDMDGNGYLDIVAGHFGEQSVVYLNDGAGHFPLEQGRNFGTREDDTRSVAVGDMDGDGYLDIVAGNGNGQSMVYLNDRTGHFPPERKQTFGTREDDTQSVAVGDMDGDGYLDIVAGNGSGQNMIYLNDGAGHFSSERKRNFGTGEDDTRSVAVGDIDGNGYLDIVVGNGNKQSMVYLNDGTGHFPPEQKRTFAKDDYIWDVVVGDMDGDGHLDIIIDTSGQNMVYLNDGTGHFPPEQKRTFGPENNFTESVAVGDMDGDGYLDIVTGHFGEQSVVYLNDGTGHFPLEQRQTFGSRSNDTYSVAVGDMDSDGNLDIVAGNGDRQSVVYLNNGAGHFPLEQKRTFGPESNSTESVAVGDMDGDDDLDVVVGNGNRQSMVYLNDGTGHFPLEQGRNFGIGGDDIRSVAVGDMDGDGHLDIVVGNGSRQNVVYLNDGAGHFPPERRQTFGTGDDYTQSVAVGDMDGDGHLDIVAGGGVKGVEGGQNVVYLNDGAGHFPLERRQTFGTGDDDTRSVAVGDMDGDGYLDIVAGGGIKGVERGQNVVYLNDGAGHFPLERRQTFGTGDDYTQSAAGGDMDGDGDLDIVAGNVTKGGRGGQNMVYLNDGAGHFSLERGQTFGTGDDYTQSVAVGDVDGDGDLDIVTGNEGEQSVAYLNDGAGHFSLERGRDFGARDDYTQSVAVGDMDGDGRLDIIAGNYGQNVAYLNSLQQAGGLANNTPSVRMTRPLPTGNANFFSTPMLLDSPTIPLTYTLFDPEGDPAGRVVAEYSLNGGGFWQAAVPTTNTITTNLAASPMGVSHVYTWDTFASGMFGQSDNVVIRLAAYPVGDPQPPGTYRYTNTVPGPFQYPYISVTTFPFRMRGTQVRVTQQTLTGAQPISNAMVYRLPKGDNTGGFLLGNTTPFRTDNNGYLQGRGQLELGDRLLAMVPVDHTPTLTWTDGISLYYTSPAFDNIFTVATPGVQQVEVSAEHPLLLANLHVSLEWDARQDPTYLPRLQSNLELASSYLYDFTDGQMALGQVYVYQNSDDWGGADVVVYANNHLRPFAVIGGAVITPTLDISPSLEITYEPGQILMGAIWNKYGDPGYDLDRDWALALAHELAHYFLFLDDTYLGLNEKGLLIALDDCAGSAMGDIYQEINTEFVFDRNEWLHNCKKTLTHQTLNRPEWDIVADWYPWFHPATTLDPGPEMSFDLTTIQVFAPFTPTENLIADPVFEPTNFAGTASAEAQAYLLRDDHLIELGRPEPGEKNRILARGAGVGDRLCLVDPIQNRYGCRTVQSSNKTLPMYQNTAWKPVVQLSPVTSQSIAITVDHISSTFTLRARLYPEYGDSQQPITLVNQAGDGLYSGVFALPYPAFSGYVIVWASEGTQNEPADDDPQVLVRYGIGGRIDEAFWQGSGPHSRGSGPHSRGSGPHSRGSGTFASPDGRMVFFNRDLSQFRPGDLYIVQNVSTLPPLPKGKIAVGQSYSLLGSPGASTVLTGSISFNYLSVEALVAKVDEDTLAIYYWNGHNWSTLESQRDPYFNMVSAPSRGAGIYALLAGVAKPQITAIQPSLATNDITHTLVISGRGFLSPTQVILIESDHTYILPVLSVDDDRLTAEVSQGLAAGEYYVWVFNLNQPGGAVISLEAGTFALFDPVEACFYDLFESGPDKWERNGEWGIVTLADNNAQVMTDSPGHSYRDAIDYGQRLATYTTTITSVAFALDTRCPNPRLIFKHDHAIFKGDMARVEISQDNGTTWSALKSYQDYTLNSQNVITTSEWSRTPFWSRELLDLSPYTGTVRLRFSLEVNNDTITSKGWAIDEVLVTAKPEADDTIFLPIITKAD